MQRKNPIIDSDSYKVGHYCQYRPNTQRVHSYFESRGGEFAETTFFGLQYIIKEHLLAPVTTSHIEEAKRIFKGHFSGNDYLFYEKGWNLMLERYEGFLPISIRAVPEGMTVPTGNVLMTVENTDPDFWWLTSYLETLLVQIWYPTTVATNSREIKKDIARFLDETGDPHPENVAFKLHDFGFRGVTCAEQAGIGGAAHLVNFLGTDTMRALLVVQDYYNMKYAVAGHSIPAAEHSTITSWGRKNEYEAFANMLEQFPKGLVAVVSDSYDIYAACRAWGTQFKEQIMNRDGTVVVRPDSGYPPDVVVRVLNILGENFTPTINEKGYKVLPPQIRVIQGDGIDRQMVTNVLTVMKSAGWSADNIAFGSGGGLLQRLDRDTCKFAFKTSAIKVNNTWINDISKDPITDEGKKSKPGRLSLVLEGNKLVTRAYGEKPLEGDFLREVYRNGELLIDDTFDQIRARASGL